MHCVCVQLGKIVVHSVRIILLGNTPSFYVYKYWTYDIWLGVCICRKLLILSAHLCISTTIIYCCFCRRPNIIQQRSLQHDLSHLLRIIMLLVWKKSGPGQSKWLRDRRRSRRIMMDADIDVPCVNHDVGQGLLVATCNSWGSHGGQNWQVYSPVRGSTLCTDTNSLHVAHLQTVYI